MEQPGLCDRPDQPPRLPEDVCASRSRDNEQSAAANRVVTPHKAEMRGKIIAYAKTVRDFTLRDLCEFFGKTPNSLSGRCTELFELGDLIKTGETRQRCTVYRLVQ